MGILDRLKAPTPKFWNRLGNALFAMAGVVAVGGMWQFDNLKEIFTIPQIRAMVVISLISGALGKGLTMLFVDKSQDKSS